MDGLCKPGQGLWAHLPAGQTVAALGLAVQQLLVKHLALLLPAALLLQLLELQVFKELGLRLQGLRFLCRTRLLRGGSLSLSTVWGEPGSSGPFFSTIPGQMPEAPKSKARSCLAPLCPPEVGQQDPLCGKAALVLCLFHPKDCPLGLCVRDRKGGHSC